METFTKDELMEINEIHAYMESDEFNVEEVVLEEAVDSDLIFLMLLKPERNFTNREKNNKMRES